MLYGDRAPSEDFGKDGDFYLQVEDGDTTVWGPKTEGSWSSAKVLPLNDSDPIPLLWPVDPLLDFVGAYWRDILIAAVLISALWLTNR